MLVGRVNMEHGTRDRIRLEVGVGSAEQPRWYYEFRIWRRPQVDQPFPANPMVSELTDGTDLLNGGRNDSVHVLATDELADGTEGRILRFRAEHRQWQTLDIWDDTPVIILDHGIPALARAPVPSSGVEEKQVFRK